ALTLLHPHCAATAAATPMHATTALAHRQPPCQGAATPMAGAATPVGGRVGRRRLPLQLAWPWVGTPTRGLAMAGYPCKGSSRGWSPLLVVFTIKTQQECVK
ncbi:hypothetical protein BHE74_00037089, partial [Ensete ventricosum]